MKLLQKTDLDANNFSFLFKLNCMHIVSIILNDFHLTLWQF